MTTISAKSILASRHAVTGDTIHTLLLRYPRWIHAEARTHRLMKITEDMEVSITSPSLMEDENLSRNASSSRAIPVEKLIQDVMDDPAVPLFWGANQKGMQASEECDEEVRLPFYDYAQHFHDYEGVDREQAWLRARDKACYFAEAFAKAGYHKQLVNRLLEPFSHITVVASATNWSNFLYLRDHEDAEPHIQMLAKSIRACIEGATVRELEPGDWHLPFVGNDYRPVMDLDDALKLSTSCCASTSYKTVEGFDMTLERATALHDKLVGMDPLHASPCEHVCQADKMLLNYKWEHPEQHGNFTGFRQYRKMLAGECR